jgi:8-oxo-dGTP pyrophosphatase MutT (NUDIX family)
VAQFASSTHVSQLTRFVPSEGEGRHAAVLILLGEGPEVVLVQRAGGDALHSGQPAFPGGVVEPSDTDPIDAALRETYEEIGVAREEVIPFALLPDLLIPVSDFVVSPVLALWSAPRAVTAQDLNEISSVHRVPIRDLAAADNRCSVRHPSGFLSPGFEVCSMLVWGFTAGILNGLLREAGWEEPWDSERVITLSG